MDNNFMTIVLRSVRVAERLAPPTSDHRVAGSNPAGGEILPEPKRLFIAQSLSCSPKFSYLRNYCRYFLYICLIKRRKITLPENKMRFNVIQKCMNIIIWDYESVWPDSWPQNKCRSLWPIFDGPVILCYILKTFWCVDIMLGDDMKYVTYISWPTDFIVYLKDYLLDECHIFK